MPTKRRRIAHTSVLGPVEAEHLQLGPSPDGHLLAGHCTLCGAHSSIVKAAWEAQRDRLMAAGWSFPFPMYGQAKFDGVELGEPREPLSVYELIREALDDA